jgi:hypothetical protein
VTGPARGDTEIEKYFDMSVVLIPLDEALRAVGDTFTSMETVGALMAARTELQLQPVLQQRSRLRAFGPEERVRGASPGQHCRSFCPGAPRVGVV